MSTEPAARVNCDVDRESEEKCASDPRRAVLQSLGTLLVRVALQLGPEPKPTELQVSAIDPKPEFQKYREERRWLEVASE